MSSPALVTDAPGIRTGHASVIGAMVAAAIVAVAWSASSLGLRDHWWAIITAIALGSAVGSGLPSVRASVHTPGVLPFAVLSAAVAIYGCVPETDQMREVGFTVALIVLIEVVRWRPLPTVWHACGAALVGWSGLYGATGRESALIGALFALGAIPLLHSVERLAAQRARTLSERTRWFVLGAASVSAVVMARTGGIAMNTATALRWLALWTAVEGACCALAVTVLTMPNNSRTQD